MSKLKETNLLIEYLTKLEKSNLKVDNTVMLLDIAKSLAMIVDKLCGTDTSESEVSDEKT